MYFLIALLYIILIVEAYTALTATKLITFIQDTENIEKRFKIALDLYFKRNCDKSLRMMNDLTTLAKQLASDEN